MNSDTRFLNTKCDLVKKCIIFLYLFSLNGFYSGRVIAAEESLSISLRPIQDATVVEGSSTAEGNSDELILANTDTDFKSFLVQFDTTNIPSDAVIQNAVLTFYQGYAEGENVQISAYRVTAGWDEASVTGSPSYNEGIDYGAFLVDNSLGVKSVPTNLQDLVDDWRGNSSSNFGLYFKANDRSSDYVHEFWSREGSSEYCPCLSITYYLLDQDPPDIFDIAVANITSTSMEVSWKTDENATSFVEFGETLNYGRVVGNDESFVTQHKVNIPSLKSDTICHFRIKSKDEAGNEAVSEDRTFKTLANGVEDEISSEKREDVVSEGVLSPTNLKAVFLQENEQGFVELRWDASEEQGIDGYKIFRSEGDHFSYVLLAEVGSDEVYYKDEVSQGETYFYVIRTVKGDKESVDSNEAMIITGGKQIGEVLQEFSFWKGFMIFNVIALLFLGVIAFIYKKKGGSFKFLKKRKKTGKSKRGQ